MKSGEVREQTDGQTDRQTDRGGQGEVPDPSIWPLNEDA
jgi:hypothetical protein